MIERERSGRDDASGNVQVVLPASFIHVSILSTLFNVLIANTPWWCECFSGCVEATTTTTTPATTIVACICHYHHYYNYSQSLNLGNDKEKGRQAAPQNSRGNSNTHKAALLTVSQGQDRKEGNTSHGKTASDHERNKRVTRDTSTGWSKKRRNNREKTKRGKNNVREAIYILSFPRPLCHLLGHTCC